MIEWITIAELAQLLNRTYEATKKIIYRAKFTTQIISTPRGRQLQISVQSLLENNIITARQAEQLLLNKATAAATAIQPSEGNRLLASSIVRKQFCNLTETEEEFLSAIPNWRELRRSEIVDILATQLHVSRAWLYRDHTNDKRKEKESAFLKLTPAQQQIVQQLLLKNHTRKAFVTLCMNNESLPDYSARTWYRIADELAKELHYEHLFVQQGPIALRQSTPAILRDRTHLRPLEVIVGDYWRVDRIVKWIDGELVMPYLCVWIDWRTYKIVGYALAKTPNSLGVKTALYVCFTRHGVPQYAYMDNGKEFRAARVSGSSIEEVNVKFSFDEVDDLVKQLEYKGIITGLGIRDINAIFKNPRAKIVERAFGRGGFTDWAKEFQDWTGAKYWQQPEWLKMNVNRYRSEKKVRTIENLEFVNKHTGEIFRFADYYDLAASIQEFIDRHNNRISTGYGMDEMSPNMLWEKLNANDTVRKIPAATIAFHFLEGTVKKVRSDGKIEFKKHFFYESSRLMQHRLKRVYVKYNPIDGFWFHRPDGAQHEFLPNSLLVFDESGKYIDEALYCQRAHPIAEEHLAERMKKQGEFQKNVRESVQSILSANVPLIANTPPEKLLQAHEEEQRRQEQEQEEQQRKQNPFMKIVF